MLVVSQCFINAHYIILTLPTRTGSGPVYSSMTKNWFQTHPRLDLWSTWPCFPVPCLCLCSDKWPTSTKTNMSTIFTLQPKIKRFIQVTLHYSQMHFVFWEYFQYTKLKSGWEAATSWTNRPPFELWVSSSKPSWENVGGCSERHTFQQWST